MLFSHFVRNSRIFHTLWRKSHFFFKITVFSHFGEIHVIFPKNDVIGENHTFFTLCEKITVFFKNTLFQNHGFFTLLEKSRFFHTFGEITVFSHLVRKSRFFHTFTEFRAFFKTSVFLKNSPFKVRFRIPYKNSVCFAKIPRSENYRCYKFRGFSPENSVFYKIPRFSYF